jgi:hypothetical protein
MRKYTSPCKGEVDSICPRLARGQMLSGGGSRLGTLSTIMAGSRDPTRLATLADLPLSGGGITSLLRR